MNVKAIITNISDYYLLKKNDFIPGSNISIYSIASISYHLSFKAFRIQNYIYTGTERARDTDTQRFYNQGSVDSIVSEKWTHLKQEMMMLWFWIHQIRLLFRYDYNSYRLLNLVYSFLFICMMSELKFRNFFVSCVSRDLICNNFWMKIGFFASY